MNKRLARERQRRREWFSKGRLIKIRNRGITIKDKRFGFVRFLNKQLFLKIREGYVLIERLLILNGARSRLYRFAELKLSQGHQYTKMILSCPNTLPFEALTFSLTQPLQSFSTSQ